MEKEKLKDLINPDEIKQQTKHATQKEYEQALLEQFTLETPVFNGRFVFPFLKDRDILKNTLHKNLQALVEANVNYQGYNYDSHLINTYQGVLNIRTGQLEERNGRLFDRIIPVYDPQATAPAFQKLLNNYNTPEYPDLSKDLLKLFAYQLFGENRLKTFFIVHGLGDNAKSTLWNLIENALGKKNQDGYASKVDGMTFAVKKDRFNVGLPALHNSRFSFADELKEDIELDGNIIKQVVAGKGSNVVFEEKNEKTQKTANIISPIVMLVNGVPNFKNADQATINRIALIEFTKVFKRGDSNAEKLINDAMHEQAGIFNLIVEAYDAKWTIPDKWRQDAVTVVNEQVNDDDELYHLSQALSLTVEYTHDPKDKVRRAELHAELDQRYYNDKDVKRPKKRELEILFPTNYDIGVSSNDYTRILIKK